jgi:hypothetical protein
MCFRPPVYRDDGALPSSPSGWDREFESGLLQRRVTCEPVGSHAANSSPRAALPNDAVSKVSHAHKAQSIIKRLVSLTPVIVRVSPSEDRKQPRGARGDHLPA